MARFLCVLATVLATLVAAPAAAETLDVGPAGTPYTASSSRGFWFTAPSTFTMTSLNVPGTGLQNIQVVRFTGGVPSGAGTTAHTTLYVTTNNTSTGPISVDIDIAAGDIIGLLGTRGSNGSTVVNAYGTGGSYTSTIDGNAVTLSRLYYQSSTLPAGTIHGSTGTISRIEVEYEPQQPFTAGTQTSVYSSQYRGYWFTAPAAMTIDGLQVPTTAGTGDQNIQVMRFNTAAPPTFSASTTDFTSLFTTLNNTAQGFIPTSIAVAAGDIIGILGARGVNGTSGVSNSYGPSSPYSTTLDGVPVTLSRMVYQSNNLPAGAVSNNNNSNIGRIEFLYTPSSANTPPVASAGLGLAGIEGSAVSFAGTYTDPDPNDTHTYLWDFGDGTTSTAQRPAHIYVDDGSYTATFTITDAAGASDSDTTTAVISNVAPTISSATNSGALLEGRIISFSTSFSDPGNLDTHTYLWNFGDGVTSVAAAPAHMYTDNGAFAASVSVTDDDGAFDTFNFSVAIANVNPVANAGPNQSGTNSTPVSFSGSVTDQGSADTHTYVWAFGNGTFSTLQSPSFSYAAAGVYTATFTATDDDGGSDSDTATITITDNAPVANAGSNRTGNEGSAISFAGTFTDQGSGHTFLWNFGDGATATTQVATHTYADNATYQTTFTVTDAAGNFDTDNATATIANVAPSANAGANQSGNEGASLAFSGTFTDPGAADTHSYLWNFGDGTSATTRNAPHTYADNGAYTATFTVTDDDGAVDSDSQIVTVSNVAPTLGAISLTGGLVEGTSIGFSSFVTDPGTVDTFTYLWDFGDGSSPSTSPAPTHAYADDATYTVTVTVTDDDNGTDTATDSVVIANAAPVANAGPNLNGPDATPLTFSGSFTDAGSADTHVYLWNFGDGTTSTSLTTTHTYSGAGTYTGTLTVTDDDGASDTDTTVVTITAGAPVAGAGANQSGNEGSSFSFAGTFTDQGTGHTFLWAFGDGTTATTQSATHTYVDNGAYNATFTVTDAGGLAGSDIAVVTVANVDPVISAGANQTGNEGATLTFTSTVTDVGSVDTFTYLWDFGDNTMSTAASPTHAYADDGTFAVTATVTDDDGGSDSDTLTATISNVAPTVSIAGPSTGAESASLAFTGTFTDPGTADTLTYLWDFGDGTNNSTSLTPTHAWTNPGSYTLTLTVTDDDGGVGTASQAVTVTSTAPTVVAGGNTQDNEGDLVSFNGSFTDGGTGHTYLWDFGDGNTDTSGVSPTHTYVDDGTFTVTFTVTDSSGLSGSDTLTATIVNLNPTAGGTFSAGGAEGGSLSFSSSPTDPGSADTFTYLWDFGDTNTSTSQNPTHTYADDGSFSVSLTVTDDDGGSDTESATVPVTNVNPVANAGTPPTGAETTPLSFTGSLTDLGTADTHTYLWDFGDGNTDSTTLTPTHTYAAPGSFVVTLTVTDDDGGTDSDIISAVVTNTAPTASILATTSAAEGTAVAFTGAFTDGGAGHTYLWDFGDATTDTSGLTPSHAYADDGTYTVTLTVTDAGGLTSSATETQVITNVAPAVSGGTPPTGDEGSLLTFTGSYVDAGSADTQTYIWDFGDSSTNTSSLSPAHTYVDDGTFTVTLTVTDDDGGVGVDTLSVVVTNAAPSVSTLVVPASTDEGTIETLMATYTDPGSVDAVALTYLWDFGDTNTDTNASPVTHQWDDNGTFTVSVTVTDPQGATGTDTATITVNNVAPSITSTAPLFGIESQLYTYAAAASDPGSSDVLTWMKDAASPAWLTLNPASGLLEGTPPVGSDGSYPITLTVTDDDGASDLETFTLVVGFEDLDGDGMADLWETANGLDPTDPTDAATDPDLDGLANLVEFLGGTDPNVFDGPSVPVLLSPIADVEVATALPTLSVQNSTDNQGDVLEYTYELYNDLSMTTLVFIATVSEGTAITEVIPDNALTENRQYAWRAEAADPFVGSGFSSLEPFFVNEVNDAPQQPVLIEPVNGQGVDSFTPTFRWDDFSDVDRDTGEFRFVLETADGTPVRDEVVRFDPIARDSEHRFIDPLEEDVAYVWRVLAMDDHGLGGPWSLDGEFLVNTDNSAPTATVFIDPVDGDILEEISPMLVASEAEDAEGAALSYLFEIDTVDTFDGPDRDAEQVDGTGTGTVEWPTTLREHTTWFLRVRATDDLGAVSPVDTIQVFVRGPNDPPTVPVLASPEDGLSTEITTHALVAVHATDPEGDDLVYEFRMSSDLEGTDVLDEVTAVAPSDGPEGTADQTSWQVELVGPGTVYWTARAVDDAGAASEWATPWSITVPEADLPPPNATETCAECESSFVSPERTRNSAMLVLGFIALVGARRRRG